MLLTDGDCTKREAVLWGLAMQDTEPYLQRRIEQRAADQALLSVLGVSLPWLKASPLEELPVNQPVGQACGGKLIERCGTFFGETLHVACRSCPGPG